MDIWDIVQHVQIQNLKGRLAGGDSGAMNAAAQARILGNEVNDRVERLVLVTEAMWELLSERFELTAADLAEKVRKIVARYGNVDGRRGEAAGKPRIRCSACQAAIPLGKTRCQFCGAAASQVEEDPFRV